MKNFRNYLKKELKERQRRNPRYSLRSFARQLNMDASTLSKMMNARLSIGPIVMKKMAKQLGISATELQLFSKEHALASDYLFQAIDLQSFESISEWYHQAILELMTIEGFQGTPEWISGQLNISIREAKKSIQALQNLKLIAIQEDGSWLDQSQGATTNIHPGMTSLAARQLQRNFLEKAQISLEKDALDIRDHSSLTFAVNKNQVGDLKKLIKKFRFDVAQLIEAELKKDSVYNLTIAMFPITKPKNKTKEIS